MLREQKNTLEENVKKLKRTIEKYAVRTICLDFLVDFNSRHLKF